MRFVFKGSSSVLDKVPNISIILIFIQSVNESQEGTNRAALCGQSTRLLHSLPADEKLMRANSVLPLYLNRFGTWQSQSHVQSGTASTWTWLACQSNPPLPRATKKAGCPFVLNWKKYSFVLRNILLERHRRKHENMLSFEIDLILKQQSQITQVTRYGNISAPKPCAGPGHILPPTRYLPWCQINSTELGWARIKHTVAQTLQKPCRAAGREAGHSSLLVPWVFSSWCIFTPWTSGRSQRDTSRVGGCWFQVP